MDPRRGGLELGFGEFAITLEAEEIRPGPVTVVVRNGGELVHGFEIKIEETDGDHSGPGHSGDGEGFEAEGAAFGPGETVRIPLDLAPGVYERPWWFAEAPPSRLPTRSPQRRTGSRSGTSPSRRFRSRSRPAPR